MSAKTRPPVASIDSHTPLEPVPSRKTPSLTWARVRVRVRVRG